METHLKTIFEYLYITIGTFGVAIIVWGVILSVYKLLKLEFNRLQNKSIYRERESVRRQFASYLLFALEFLIAADIIATVIHPAFEEITILASIVVIRTMISYFLEKEISKFDAIGVFALSTLQSGIDVFNFIEEKKPVKAVIVGGGYAGMEMAEALLSRSIDVTLIDLAPQLMATLDKDMADLILKYMSEQQVKVFLEEKLVKFEKIPMAA